MNAWLHANNYHPPAHDFQFVKNKPTLNDANEIREEVEAMQRLKYKILSNPSEEAMTMSDESFEDDEYKTKDDSVNMLLFTFFFVYICYWYYVTSVYHTRTKCSSPFFFLTV